MFDLHKENGIYHVFSKAEDRIQPDPDFPNQVSFEAVADILRKVDITKLVATPDDPTIRLGIVYDDSRWSGHPIFNRIREACTAADLHFAGSPREDINLSCGSNQSDVPRALRDHGAEGRVVLCSKKLPQVITTLIAKCEELAAQEGHAESKKKLTEGKQKRDPLTPDGTSPSKDAASS